MRPMIIRTVVMRTVVIRPMVINIHGGRPKKRPTAAKTAQQDTGDTGPHHVDNYCG